DQQQNGFSFDRYGVRVPTLFISPLISPRTIIRSDDTAMPFDHTSVIATILKWQNIEKTRWHMGARVDAAPAFDQVITLATPRNDPILAAESLLPLGNDQTPTVCLGEAFYLHNAYGDYVAKKSPFKPYAPLGSYQDKVPIQFLGGAGKITHGSFVL